MNAKLVSNSTLQMLYQKLLKDDQGTYVFESEGGCYFGMTLTAIGYR